jgi:sugar-specific transcriptional regulator TrmB
MYQNVLEEAGLTKTEALVYNTFLILKQATPKEIAKESGITRENAYQIINKLLSYNLISQIPEKRPKTYIVESPDKLLDLFNKHTQEVKDTQTILSKFIDRLESEKSLQKVPTVVSYYRGVDGVKQGYMESISDPKATTRYGLMSRTWPKEFMYWIDNTYVPERLSRNITLHLILTHTKEKLEGYIKTDIAKKRYVQHMDIPDFPTDSSLIVCGSKVYMTTHSNEKSLEQKDSAVVIDQSDIAKTMEALFKLVWQSD